MTLFKTLTIGAMLAITPAFSALALADDAPKLEGLAVVDAADISVGLNGLVCDFCSIALNKTFRKDKAVRAIYVDLDSKIMSIALHDGASLTDKQIEDLVKKSGYSVTSITRKNG